MFRCCKLLLLLGLVPVSAVSCAGEDAGSPAASSTVDRSPRGLLLALAQFEVTPEGKTLPKPKAARLEILVRRGDEWEMTVVEDPASNVFHKAMVYDDGILTLGGTSAALKLWRKGPNGLAAETLWEKDFGGKFSRMRDAEVLDLGDGKLALAVATHDQGVVAIVSSAADGTWKVEEIDRQKNTIVHEIEVGDLDGDGAPEIYATPSEPNLFDGKPQSGKVVRYVPSKGNARTVVANLGDRHAKEILVADVDGDGRDELYVAVEAMGVGRLEIRRYDADTPPEAGKLIARLEAKLCRFLTAGDVDGDGKREIVAAGIKSGLWLLRPPDEDGTVWQLSSIDRASSGFEHAALLTDLDGDGIDELYVASDDQGEVREYRWRDGRFEKKVIQRRAVPDSVFTWNLMAVPVELVE